MLSADPPTGIGWIHEVKHDGFRTLLRLDRGQVQAFTCKGHGSDKCQRGPSLHLRCPRFLLRSLLTIDETLVMLVILSDPEAWKTWLTGSVDEVLELQSPLPPSV